MTSFDKLFIIHKDIPSNELKNFNDIFKKIDSEDKAYFLGRMCYMLNDNDNLNDSYNKVDCVKFIFEKEKKLPDLCVDFLYCKDVEVVIYDNYYVFSINKKIVNEILLNYTFVDEKLKLYYYRAIIETYSNFSNFVLKLTLKKKSMLDSICKYFDLQTQEDTALIIKNINLIDFLGKLYKDHKNLYEYNFFNKYNYTLYKYNHIDTKGMKWSVIKKDPDAVIPYKTNFSDIGFDVTVIKKVKDLTSTTALYDTGLVVIPPLGYCIEIFPRSSLSKSGFSLANSVGLMDPSYRGNLFIPLTNTAPEKKIELPFRCCQIVLKKHYIIELELKESHEETNRGSGGFGSTG